MAEPATTPWKRILAGAMLLGYALLIYGGSSGPAPDVIVSLEIPDKVLHAVEYGVLGFLCARFVFHLTLRTGAVVLLVLPVLLCALYGVSDEIHQSFVAGRDSSFADGLADTVGAALGAFLYRWLLLARLAPRAAPESEQ